MTVIAYKDGVLAADGLTLYGDTIVTKTEQKIFQSALRPVPGFGRSFWMGGGAGGAGVLQKVKNFLGYYPDENSINFDALDNGETMLLISPVRTIYHVYKGGYSKINFPWWAIGSGGDIAIGAMAAGASASEAVGFAHQYNVGCGILTSEIRFPKKD